MPTFTNEEVAAEVRELQERYPHVRGKLGEALAEIELWRRWRLRRAYDHTDVVPAPALPGGVPAGQVRCWEDDGAWAAAFALSLPELTELRDQIDAFLRADGKS